MVFPRGSTFVLVHRLVFGIFTDHFFKIDVAIWKFINLGFSSAIRWIIGETLS